MFGKSKIRSGRSQSLTKISYWSSRILEDNNMQRKLIRVFLIIVFIFTLLPLVQFIPAQAQGSVATPTSTPISTQTDSPNSAVTPTPTVVQFSNPNVVTFAQLRKTKTDDIMLTGPYDTDGIGFSLPANWALVAGTQLDLLVGVSFNTNTDNQNQADVVVIGGGTLSILLNDVLLQTLQLNELGEIETKISIPMEAFNAVSSDGLHILSFVLESSESCRFYGQNTTVYVHQTSFLTLPHEIVEPSTSLANFPRPIFQNSFIPDSALIIVPDQPSSTELQAALTTAASMSKFSSGEMILDMTTFSKFENVDASKNHLIFVGKAASLTSLAELKLPLPLINGQFQLPSDSPDDGLVEMILSPWSDSHVILVISGNTDQGVDKAAQAVSTGIIRSNQSDNFAVIQQVSLEPPNSPQTVDRTLADLGYEGRTFGNRGFNAAYYDFNIPVGMSVSPDSYFEMVYGHSKLIDYNSSEIVVLLNNQPIGSVRMSDTTADLPTNKVKIMIPPSIVTSGNNYLVVQVYLVPLDDCAPPDIQGLWVNIWPESTLHIPQTASPASPFALQKLSNFPEPFTFNSVLDTTAFVLEHDNLDSWRNALQIAAYLGWQSSGPVIALSAFYGDEIPTTERSNYNLLVVGKPTQIPFMNEVNDYLPAPFLTGSDKASEGNNFQVTYQIPPDSPLGYLEIIQSPWNPNNIVLAVLGNTPEGINWAASALLDTMRWQLSGNFAVLNGKQIFSADTISSYVTVDNNSTPIPNVLAVPTSVNLAISPATQQNWIVPTLIITIVLIIMTLAFVIIRSWMRNRTRRSSRVEKES
jgi:Bacterial cellulose synthase subunit